MEGKFSIYLMTNLQHLHIVFARMKSFCACVRVCGGMRGYSAYKGADFVHFSQVIYYCRKVLFSLFLQVTKLIKR